MNPSLLIVTGDEVLDKLSNCMFHRELSQFREPEVQREKLKQLVKKEIAQMGLIVAGESIVGYAVILPPEKEERWSQLPYISMLGVVEVAPDFRRSGLAKQLLNALLANQLVEDKILVSLEYYWHWDLKNSNLKVYEYKHMLKHLLSSVGMEEFYTDDPDINAHWANFMMAYIGQKISSSQLQQFMYLANPRVF